MDRAEVLDVLLALVDGVNPETGEVVEDDHVLSGSTVLRALFHAARHLEQCPHGVGNVEGEPEPEDDLTAHELAIVAELKDLRSVIAQRENYAVWWIFPNRTMCDLAKQQPTSTSELRRIHGIGSKRLAAYGTEILDAIARAGGGLERDPATSRTASEWSHPSPARTELNTKLRLPSRAYAPWTSEEEEKLAELYRKGWLPSAIASSLDRRISAIRTRIEKLGLHAD